MFVGLLVEMFVGKDVAMRASVRVASRCERNGPSASISPIGITDTG
jgi:hypothetical protein